ncbi:MAG: hypothetical protein ABI433_12425 [Burkholderiaceae bacterium]
MLGRSRPIPFNPYGRRRSGFRLPRWLVLLLLGVAAGVAGVIVVQERYLPPRLSADASVKLTAAFDQADADRLRLKGELAETAKRLETTRAERQALTDELAASRATTTQLRDDVSSVVAALPPDPRGGSVEVRAGRLSVKSGQLAYDVVLTREHAAGKPMAGVLQLIAAGEGARGADTAVPLKPITLSIGSQLVVRGSLPLPDGLRPRQATIQVLDRVGGKLLGMRVILVK